ncbi:unnamed protein product [Cylicostephanus goldi]|uniref:Cell division protein FtsL n=1 Tax=Cylicostephanus goldi TaxID=71465 RepID=A0A3P6SU02_CYLGO|nr:unnamed protein product [Cylicostephanus goldi]
MAMLTILVGFALLLLVDARLEGLVETKRKRIGQMRLADLRFSSPTADLRSLRVIEPEFQTMATTGFLPPTADLRTLRVPEPELETMATIGK